VRKAMIKKMSHIGILVNNIEEATKFWAETFGFEISHGGNAKVEGIKNIFLKAGNNFIELMEPIDHEDMNNAMSRRLKEKGEGVFHIALIVDDINLEIRRLEGKGITIIRRPPTEDQPQGRALVHPKCANGAMLELLT